VRERGEGEKAVGFSAGGKGGGAASSQVCFFSRRRSSSRRWIRPGPHSRSDRIETKRKRGVSGDHSSRRRKEGDGHRAGRRKKIPTLFNSAIRKARARRCEMIFLTEETRNGEGKEGKSPLAAGLRRKEGGYLKKEFVKVRTFPSRED